VFANEYALNVGAAVDDVVRQLHQRLDPKNLAGVSWNVIK